MKRKKIITLISLIVLLIIIIILQSTLGKYKKKVSTDTNLTIASWNIKINDESILNKSELTAEITPVFEDNEYVKEGVIAPGSKGYYDINIDGSLTDVSFKYKIMTEENTTDVTDIITTGYIINPEINDEIINYDTNTGIEGIINHNTKGDTIRIYIIWNDDEETQNMTNESDTLIASQKNAKATIKSSVTFEQIKQD